MPHELPPASAPQRTDLSLEWRLPLLISLLVAIVVGIACAAAYQEMRSSAVAAGTERVRTAAQQLADLSGTSTAQRTAQLATLAGSAAVRTALTGGPVATADSLLRAAARPGDSALVAMDLWGADGAVRVSSGSAPTRADSVAVAALLRSDTVARTPLYTHDGQVLLTAVVPVRDANGRGRIGVLTERRRLVNSAAVETQIRKLVGQDVDLYVTSIGGGLWSDLRGNIVHPLVARLPHARSFELGARRDDVVLAGWAPIGGTPWAFVLTTPEATVLAHSRDFLVRMLAIGALLMLVGAAGAWVVSRNVTRPLREVSDAAWAMAAGDFGQRVRVARGDEIGKLAQTFNAMASRIEASHGALAERAAAAQAANEAKTRFLALMSHELRTPLNAIGGYAELLEIGVRGEMNDAQLEDLRRIRRSKDHLLSIINDLLDHARIEAGQLAVGVTDVRLADALSEVEALTAPAIASRDLRYERRCEDASASVRADYKTLCQVLMNLVSNAVRFTEPGGTVAMACVPLGDRVEVRVSDTGIGIPPDQLEKIFEPFVQVDAGLTRRTDGTGLGLAISRTLSEAMGGTLTVVSELGRGSTFTISLPRVAPAVKPTPARGAAATV